MKKLGIILITVPTVLIGFYFIWSNLPLSINRYSDVTLGKKIIRNIKKHGEINGLPQNNDWKTLNQLSFRNKVDFVQPEYPRLDNEPFELI